MDALFLLRALGFGEPPAGFLEPWVMFKPLDGFNAEAEKPGLFMLAADIDGKIVLEVFRDDCDESLANWELIRAKQ